jgi:exodeoxyribonuclease-3
MRLFKIATWNVNSLRVRLSYVQQWLVKEQPDVLALQETKMIDEDFPVAELKEAGYESVFSGQKTYNGVAILSKVEAKDRLTDLPGLDDPQRRILAVTVGDYRIVDLYVPNGSEVGSDKYVYKLDWLSKIREYLQGELKRYPRLVVLGDFNIAPEDEDVYDPASWREKILCSTPERKAFQALLEPGLQDAFRCFEQPPKSYTWWDYRSFAFRRNRGLRIDHILISPILAESCSNCRIDIEPRKLERPSDHAPVVAEFMLSAEQNDLFLG